MASRKQHPEGPFWASPGGHVQAGQLAPNGGDGRGGPTSSFTPCDRPPEADVDCRHLPGLSGAFVSRGAGLSAVWWLTGLQGAGAWRRRGHRWLVPAQGVAEEQAPPDGSAREAGSGRCGDLRQGRGGIPAAVSQRVREPASSSSTRHALRLPAGGRAARRRGPERPVQHGPEAESHDERSDAQISADPERLSRPAIVTLRDWRSRA